MSDAHQPTFLVSTESDPVVIAINGKANYLNCNTFREFIDTMMRKGTKQFVLNFANCTGMDSTFLGIMAGTAIQLGKKAPRGALVITELSKKNFDLIKNLGLHHLLTIKKISLAKPEAEKSFSQLEDAKVSDPNEVLKAHENLTYANDENAIKFEDVISFLRKQVKDG